MTSTAPRAPATRCSSPWRTTRHETRSTRCRWAGSAGSTSSASRSGPTTAIPTACTPGAHSWRSSNPGSASTSPPTRRCAPSASTSRSRLAPSRTALRRGTMRAADAVIWDQCHILQSGRYDGTYTVAGTTYAVDGWIGQRDHSWGVRDHGRCPLWMWFQIQLDNGFLGVWHWEYENGAPSTPTAAGPMSTATTRSRSSASSTTSNGSTPTGRRAPTANTGRRSPG